MAKVRDTLLGIAILPVIGVALYYHVLLVNWLINLPYIGWLWR